MWLQVSVPAMQRYTTLNLTDLNLSQLIGETVRASLVGTKTCSRTALNKPAPATRPVCEETKQRGKTIRRKWGCQWLELELLILSRKHLEPMRRIAVLSLDGNILT